MDNNLFDIGAYRNRTVENIQLSVLTVPVGSWLVWVISTSHDLLGPPSEGDECPLTRLSTSEVNSRSFPENTIYMYHGGGSVTNDCFETDFGALHECGTLLAFYKGYTETRNSIRQFSAI